MAASKELTIEVVDENGVPLAGARGSSISYNPKTGGHGGAEWTADGNGKIICNDPPYFLTTDMRVTLSNADASAGRKAYDASLSERDFIRFVEPKLALKISVPYIRNPIPLKAKAEAFNHRRVNRRNEKEISDASLPDLAVTEVGYDAEMLELMPPHGQGRHLDFSIRVVSVFRGFSDSWSQRRANSDVASGAHTMGEGKVTYGDWTHTISFSFPNKGDGAILSPQFWPYCKLTVPHQAPETGYAQELSLTEIKINQPSKIDLGNYRERMTNNGVFLRVRTQLDKDGNVITAHYAKLVSPEGAGNKFLIFFNPTPNDRNLEYDLKTNLRWQELHPLSKEPPPWNSPYDVKSN